MRVVEIGHIPILYRRYEARNCPIQWPAMPEIIVVYWRDIPAQVIVGKGRRAAKVQLSERFEQAIDRCAMRIGAKDTDSYLAEWRKVPLREVEGNANSLAESESSRLEMEYDSVRLAYLVENGGWENESNLAGAAKL